MLSDFFFSGKDDWLDGFLFDWQVLGSRQKNMPDYFAIVGVSRGASAAEIKKVSCAISLAFVVALNSHARLIAKHRSFAILTEALNLRYDKFHPPVHSLPPSLSPPFLSPPSLPPSLPPSSRYPPSLLPLSFLGEPFPPSLASGFCGEEAAVILSIARGGSHRLGRT